MSRILDLGLFQEETLDIKTVIGDTINVKKPTEELAIKLISYQFKMKEFTDKESSDYTEEDLTKLMKYIEELTMDILNHNKNKLEVTKEFIKENEINYSMQVAILNAYTEFMNEIAADPNSKSPQSQVKKKGRK